MNENNIIVVAKSTQTQDEIELNLLDLLAELLLKWKSILALLLIGAILGFGVAQIKGGGKEFAVCVFLCFSRRPRKYPVMNGTVHILFCCRRLFKAHFFNGHEL